MSDNFQILLEDINHKFDVILEGQVAMAHIPGDVAELKADMKDVKADIKIIKLAYNEQSKDHQHLAKRVTKLEQARA